MKKLILIYLLIILVYFSCSFKENNIIKDNAYLFFNSDNILIR